MTDKLDEPVMLKAEIATTKRWCYAIANDIQQRVVSEWDVEPPKISIEEIKKE